MEEMWQEEIILLKNLTIALTTTCRPLLQTERKAELGLVRAKLCPMVMVLQPMLSFVWMLSG